MTGHPSPVVTHGAVSKLLERDPGVSYTLSVYGALDPDFLLYKESRVPVKRIPIYRTMLALFSVTGN